MKNENIYEEIRVMHSEQGKCITLTTYYNALFILKLCIICLLCGNAVLCLILYHTDTRVILSIV